MRCGPKTGWCRRVPECDRCTLAATSEPHWRNWGLSGPLVPYPPAPAVAPESPCSHRSAAPVRTAACRTCGGGVRLKVYGCAEFGECTIGKRAAFVSGCCDGCPRHTGLTPAARPVSLAPLSRETVDTCGFARTPDRGPFNGGEIEYRGRRLLFYRVGMLASRVHVAELDAAGAVVRDVPLDLSRPMSRHGQEDPAPFVFRDRLHVAFTGWIRDRGTLHIFQMYAALRDDLTVEAVYAPDYGGRPQKNWGFFEAGGELYAVYSISPHVVLHIDGDRAEKVAESPYPFPWAGGHLRGGAAPVLVGGRFVSWFHGKIEPRTPLLYSVGVYTFAAEPPFAPIAGSPIPLLWGDDAEARRVGCDFSVVFPRGAILRGGAWEVTGGEYDTRLARWTWDAAAVDRLLAPPA